MSAPARRPGLLTLTGSVAGLTLVSRVLGFVRWIVQATAVGAGTVAGAYATANQIPNVLYEVVVGGALAATVVPLLASAVGAGRRAEAERTASGLLGLVLVILVPLSLLLVALATPLAGLLPASQGVDPDLQRRLVADFLRMFALQVPLYGVGVVLTGVLQAHHHFTWPALTPVLSSLVVMATYALYGHMSAGAPDGAVPTAALQVLGWGTTAGVAALSLPLLWPVRRLGLRLHPTLRLGGRQTRRVLRLGGAGLETLLAQQASVVVVLALARAGGQTGTVAVYQYTQAIYVLPYAVLAVPVATVLYPRLAAAFEAGTHKAAPGAGPAADRAAAPPATARALTASSTALVTAVAVAGAGMLLAASAGAERFFTLLAPVSGMGAALAAMAPGLVGYALIYQVTRVLFASDHAREAARATMLGWLTVAGASALAVRLAAPAGGDGAATLIGLGIGQSTGMGVAGIGLALVLARRLGAGVLRPTGRVLAFGAPVAMAAGLASRTLSARVPSTVGAVGAAIVGAALVAAMALAAIHVADRRLLGSLRRHSTTDPTSPPGESR
ncbi:murein biosynthesis integral membrane protein MurJ [Actinomyces oricola]